jgi:hypothetical protein
LSSDNRNTRASLSQVQRVRHCRTPPGVTLLLNSCQNEFRNLFLDSTVPSKLTNWQYLVRWTIYGYYTNSSPGCTRNKQDMFRY